MKLIPLSMNGKWDSKLGIIFTLVTVGMLLVIIGWININSEESNYYGIPRTELLDCWDLNITCSSNTYDVIDEFLINPNLNATFNDDGTRLLLRDNFKILEYELNPSKPWDIIPCSDSDNWLLYSKKPMMCTEGTKQISVDVSVFSKVYSCICEYPRLIDTYNLRMGDET